jgi:hypothetical protein
MVQRPQNSKCILVYSWAVNAILASAVAATFEYADRQKMHIVYVPEKDD